ncbi:ABC transporter substrate-binding protein [Nocardioides cynanchi]|uniref:ABC transporter substrate-binding protein n=1 Tax=Nocardioides cynanchi TaxID=2558918 RepID=UPI0012479268|nr:ABC transporter substrate-binding protein [Nocardioides cynanchi]
MTTRIRSLGALIGVAALALVAGCGSQGSSTSGTPGAGGFTPPSIPMKQSMGKMEGSVNILAWPGYAEDGSNDPKVDWVTPFEQQTGCQANVKYFGTSDEAVNLLKTGNYDVVSASGDASLRLIAGGDVAPVNTSLIKDYNQIEPFLKDKAWNSVNGQMYGVPHGWGANLLMYRTDLVSPAPTSWGAVFDQSSTYKGKVTAYDSPIYIADAALYLMKTQPDLGIKNPYALDQTQLDAAVSLLKNQRANISEYWSDYLKEVSAFKSGDSVIGTTWKVIQQVAASEKAPVKAILPTEGATGWSDTWMIGAHAQHPNCAYAWMSYITEPKPQSEVAQYFGEAPANGQACKLTGAAFCKAYHTTDQAFADKIWYWTTPISQCLDGRTNTTCTNYGDWTQAWTEIKG